jgi:hypothetical protein
MDGSHPFISPFLVGKCFLCDPLEKRNMHDAPTARTLLYLPQPISRFPRSEQGIACDEEIKKHVCKQILKKKKNIHKPHTYPNTHMYTPGFDAAPAPAAGVAMVGMAMSSRVSSPAVF